MRSYLHVKFVQPHEIATFNREVKVRRYDIEEFVLDVEVEVPDQSDWGGAVNEAVAKVEEVYPGKEITFVSIIKTQWVD